MSQCRICLDYYHPDLISYTEKRGDTIKVCAFCKTDKKELTIEDENGNFVEKIEKKQSSIAYKKYLEDISKKPSVAKIIQENTNK